MPDLFYFAHAHQVESEEEDEVEGRLRAIEVERGILRRALDAPEDLESRETLVDHLHQQHSLYDLLECDIPIHLSPVDRQGLAAQLDGMQTILSILDSEHRPASQSACNRHIYRVDQHWRLVHLSQVEETQGVVSSTPPQRTEPAAMWKTQDNSERLLASADSPKEEVKLQTSGASTSSKKCEEPASESPVPTLPDAALKKEPKPRDKTAAAHSHANARNGPPASSAAQKTQLAFVGSPSHPLPPTPPAKVLDGSLQGTQTAQVVRVPEQEIVSGQLRFKGVPAGLTTVSLASVIAFDVLALSSAPKALLPPIRNVGKRNGSSSPSADSSSFTLPAVLGRAQISGCIRLEAGNGHLDTQAGINSLLLATQQQNSGLSDLDAFLQSKFTEEEGAAWQGATELARWQLASYSGYEVRDYDTVAHHNRVRMGRLGKRVRMIEKRTLGEPVQDLYD